MASSLAEAQGDDGREDRLWSTLHDGGPRSHETEAEEEQDPGAELVLSHFASLPVLDFGSLRLGRSRVLPLRLRNPNAWPVSVRVQPPPACGFSAEPRELLVQAGDCVEVRVAWSPQAPGSVRELLKVSSAEMLQLRAVMLGSCVEPQQPRRSMWDRIKNKPPAPASQRHRKPGSNPASRAAAPTRPPAQPAARPTRPALRPISQQQLQMQRRQKQAEQKLGQLRRLQESDDPKGRGASAVGRRFHEDAARRTELAVAAATEEVVVAAATEELVVTATEEEVVVVAAEGTPPNRAGDVASVAALRRAKTFTLLLDEEALADSPYHEAVAGRGGRRRGDDGGRSASEAGAAGVGDILGGGGGRDGGIGGVAPYREADCGSPLSPATTGETRGRRRQGVGRKADAGKHRVTGISGLVLSPGISYLEGARAADPDDDDDDQDVEQVEEDGGDCSKPRVKDRAGESVRGGRWEWVPGNAPPAAGTAVVKQERPVAMTTVVKQERPVAMTTVVKERPVAMTTVVKQERPVAMTTVVKEKPVAVATAVKGERPVAMTTVVKERPVAVATAVKGDRPVVVTATGRRQAPAVVARSLRFSAGGPAETFAETVVKMEAVELAVSVESLESAEAAEPAPTSTESAASAESARSAHSVRSLGSARRSAGAMPHRLSVPAKRRREEPGAGGKRARDAGPPDAGVAERHGEAHGTAGRWEAAGTQSARLSAGRPGSAGRKSRRSLRRSVAPARLSLVKPETGTYALVRHPLCFAARNMFYDERWLEKQERGFTSWLNHLLAPDDGIARSGSGTAHSAVDLTSLVATTNTAANAATAVGAAAARGGAAGIGAAPSPGWFARRRRRDALRRAASRLFRERAFSAAVARLEADIERGRIAVRPDRHMWRDVGERKKLLQWLLGYNPLWLRLGLEAVYGEEVPMEDDGDCLGLARFIAGRLLWDQATAAHYQHATVPHLHRPGMLEALSRFTLRRLLLLLVFLDEAKTRRLVPHDPCLFALNAPFKSSRDVVLAVSRDHVSAAVGDLSRRLASLGFELRHQQGALAEFSFPVGSLRTDLRCGVRLARVVELLSGEGGLCARLRVPPVSRLNKLHNVEVALDALTRHTRTALSDAQGRPIEARNVVDGHREKTLALLWQLVLHFQMNQGQYATAPPPAYSQGEPGWAPQQGYPPPPAQGYPPQQGYPPPQQGYPPPQGYPQQQPGYPQDPAYGYPPQTVVVMQEAPRNDDSCLTGCMAAMCCCCLWDMLTYFPSTPATPVVLLSGLPYSSSVRRDLVAEFLGSEVGLRALVPTFLPSGLPRGQAFALLAEPGHVGRAVARSGQRMGGRRVTVTESSLPQMESLVQRCASAAFADTCVRLRGILYEATGDDIVQFFSDLRVSRESVTLCVDEWGRGNGMAFVAFESRESAERATHRHGHTMAHRMVEVYRCRKEDIVGVIPSRALQSQQPAFPFYNPNSGPTDSGTGFQNPAPGYYDAGSRHPAAGLQNPAAEFHNHPNPAFQNPNPGFQNPNPAFNHPSQRYQEPGPSFQIPDPGFQNANAGFQNRNPQFYNASQRFQRSAAAFQNPEFENQSRRPADSAPGYGRNSSRSGRGFGPHAGVWRDGVYQNTAWNTGEQSSGFCVHMRGLPFQATEQDIIEFFSPLVPVSVSVSVSRSGRPTGEGDVQFGSADEAQRAMARDRHHMVAGHRYIELFLNAPISPSPRQPPSPAAPTPTPIAPELAESQLASHTGSSHTEEEVQQDREETGAQEDPGANDDNTLLNSRGTDDWAQRFGKSE